MESIPLASENGTVESTMSDKPDKSDEEGRKERIRRSVLVRYHDAWFYRRAYLIPRSRVLLLGMMDIGAFHGWKY